MAALPSQALRGRLAAVAAVTDLVGTRIYPAVAPEGAATPYLVLVRFDEIEEEAMTANADILSTWFHVFAVADTHDDCEALHEEVRNACRRYRGTVNSVEVTDMRLDHGEGPEYIEELQGYQAMQDIQVRYRRV